MGYLDSVALPTTPTTGGGYLSGIKVPSTAESTKIGDLQSQQQVSTANAKYQNSFLGEAENTGKALVAPIAPAFHAGIQQAEQGAKDAGQAKNPVQETEAGMEELSGAASAATSPLAPIFKPISDATTKVGDKISNVPAVQRFANTKTGATTEQVAADVGNVANIVGTVAGGLEGGEVAGDVAENIKPQVKGGYLDTVDVPEKPTAKISPKSSEQLHQEYMASQKPTETPETISTEKPTTKPTTSMQPVESSGETRTPTLAVKVDAKSVSEGLKSSLGDLPEYNKTNWEDQGKFAADIVNSDPEKATRIALGEEAPPNHVLATAVYKAVEDSARKSGDGELAQKLAQSPLTQHVTRMGQEVGYLSQRDELSPVDRIKEVENARATKANPVKLKTEVDTIKSNIKAARSPKETWQSFVDSISCK